jgi:hypothetical protein
MKIEMPIKAYSAMLGNKKVIEVLKVQTLTIKDRNIRDLVDKLCEMYIDLVEAVERGVDDETVK